MNNTELLEYYQEYEGALRRAFMGRQELAIARRMNISLFEEEFRRHAASEIQDNLNILKKLTRDLLLAGYCYIQLNHSEDIN